MGADAAAPREAERAGPVRSAGRRPARPANPVAMRAAGSACSRAPSRTQKVCSDSRWYYTCGARSICAATDAGTADAGTSLPSCGPDDKLNGACPTLGLMRDPRDNTCGRVFVCATEPSVCPFCRARAQGACARGVRLRRAPHPSARADGFSPSGGEVKSAVGKSRTPTIVTPDGPIRPFSVNPRPLRLPPECPFSGGQSQRRHRLLTTGENQSSQLSCGVISRILRSADTLSRGDGETGAQPLLANGGRRDGRLARGGVRRRLVCS